LPTIPTTQEIVTAHEIGHNFNMNHDDSCKSYCTANPADCEGDKYIKNLNAGSYVMNPIAVDGSRANNRIFSACSIFTSSPVSLILRI